MGKYDPLKNYLQAQSTERVPLRFAEIEQLVGTKLPNSKRYPAWWSNNPSNNVMTRVWLEAGFVTEQVDIPSERLVFRRVRRQPPAPPTTPAQPPSGGMLAGLRAALGSTVRFAPGFDPTEPTGEVWDAERK